MSVSQSTTTHTLPSFSQAFSDHTPMIPSDDARTNTLPPIQSPRPLQSSSSQRVASPADGARSRSENLHENKVSGRKRTRTDESEQDARTSSSVRVKEEDADSSDQAQDSRDCVQDVYVGAPPPSSLAPSSSSKKRRTTVSMGSHLHPLTTFQLPPADHSSSTPISPVVRGCTVRDEEQIRSSLSVKNHQKALIEQRRGSLSMLLSNPPMATAEERVSASSKPSARRSPNGPATASTRRPPPRAITPPGGPHHNQPSSGPASIAAHSLPPPPISFTDRRAGQIGALKKKPADILISPRDTQTQEQLQLEIQSAPPVPHARQQGIPPSRFPMALPRLPSVLDRRSDTSRRVVSTHVPPTPSRLSRNAHLAPPRLSQPSISGSGRSPPTVPIASSLHPPTPSFLQQSAPSYGDKAAFLAPFELFYDALNDCRHLKIWLSEQIQRSNVLMQNLTRQQERMEETVENLVEKRTSGLRSEVAALHRKVEELEEALRVMMNTSRRPSFDGRSSPALPTKGKSAVKNGVPGISVPESSCTFPPATSQSGDPRGAGNSVHLTSSPGRNAERGRETAHREEHYEPLPSSPPAPHDNRRLSVSAVRIDPLCTDTWEREHGSAYSKSPRMPIYRDTGSIPGATSGSPRPSERPGLLKKISSSRVHGSSGRTESAEGKSSDREHDSNPMARDTTR